MATAAERGGEQADPCAAEHEKDREVPEQVIGAEVREVRVEQAPQLTAGQRRAVVWQSLRRAGEERDGHRRGGEGESEPRENVWSTAVCANPLLRVTLTWWARIWSGA